ncbi:MAG: rhodanese-like domain-containing protein [Burkholderiaceae bacterium]
MFSSIQVNKNFLIAIAVIGIAVASLNTSPTKNGLNHGYQIQEVDPVGAQKLIDAGATIIDVRGIDQFNHRHIPGAILITLAELSAGIPAQLIAVKDKPIVVYCSDGVAHGPEGTSLLNKAGYSKAVNLKGGIEAWADAGKQVAKN